MMRRRDLVGAIGALGVNSAIGQTKIPAPAKGAEFTFTFANNLPASHPLNQRAREMAALVRKESSGAVELRIFPNNELGNDTEMLKKLRAGEINFFTLSGLILSSQVPLAAITGVGFAFQNYAEIWSAVDGDLGALIRREIAAKELHAFEKIWDNGYRQITSAVRPIVTAADLKGMKIRVPMSPMWTSLFEALGTAPTSLNFSEVYGALKAGAVDGQENPLAVIDAAKLYEVQKFCSLTFHMWDGFWFLANKKQWDGLPVDVRSLLEKRVNAAAMGQRTDIAIANAILLKELKTKGMTLNQPSTDTFKATLSKSGFYSTWRTKFGENAWSQLEKYTARLR